MTKSNQRVQSVSKKYQEQYIITAKSGLSSLTFALNASKSSAFIVIEELA